MARKYEKLYFRSLGIDRIFYENIHGLFCNIVCEGIKAK